MDKSTRAILLLSFLIMLSACNSSYTATGSYITSGDTSSPSPEDTNSANDTDGAIDTDNTSSEESDDASPNESEGGSGGDSQVVFSEMETTQLTGPVGDLADSVTDSSGVSLVIESTVAPGATVSLISNAATGKLINQLHQHFTIKAPFYSINLEGDEDLPGRATLQFPALDPEDRLAVILDNQFFFLLQNKPIDNILTTSLPLAQNHIDTDPALNVRINDTVYVTLVNPSASGKSSGNVNDPLKNQFARSTSGADYCHRFFGHNTCYNKTRNIQISWTLESYPNMSNDTAGVVITEVQKALDGYERLGIDYAQIPIWSYIAIQLEPGRKDGAVFSSNSGAIYIGNDTVNTIRDNTGNLRLAAKARLNLWHELFHYIQDFTYNMKFSRGFGDRSWWIENSAEYAPSLIDPSLTGESAKIAGKLSNEDGGQLGIQMAPFDWQPGSAGYIHAQLLMANTCENSFYCALSKSSFATITNNGVSPFRSSLKQSELLGSQPMKDYLRYLLGEAPIETNSSIFIHPGIADGTYIGDIIYARKPQFSSSEFSFNTFTDFYPPRLNKIGDDQIDINAVMGPGGAYHLRINNGSASYDTANRDDLTTWPIALTVNSATNLYYRTATTDSSGNTIYDNIKHHASADNLVLAPIHPKMGLAVARIAAYNENTKNNKTLSASVAPIDLTGHWQVLATNATLDDVQCLNSDITFSERNSLLRKLLEFSSAAGEMQKIDSNRFQYTLSSSVDLPSGSAISGEVSLKRDSVSMEQQLRFKNRFIDNLVYEDASVNIALQLDSIDYRETPTANDPLWTLTGSGGVQLQATIQGRNSAGVNVATLCSGTMQYTATVHIYPAANSEAQFPGNPLDGNFTIVSYQNFNGVSGHGSPVDPVIPDLKIYGNAAFPQISWNNPNVTALTVSDNYRILYGVVGSSDDQNNFHYVRPGISYGDYSVPYTQPYPSAAYPSPALQSDAAEYFISVVTDDPSPATAVLVFRLTEQ